MKSPQNPSHTRVRSRPFARHFGYFGQQWRRKTLRDRPILYRREAKTWSVLLCCFMLSASGRESARLGGLFAARVSRNPRSRTLATRPTSATQSHHGREPDCGRVSAPNTFDSTLLVGILWRTLDICAKSSRVRTHKSVWTAGRYLAFPAASHREAESGGRLRGVPI